MDFAVQAKTFGHMCDFQCSGDAVLPAYVGPDNIGSPLGNDLGHAPVTAACGFCCGDGDIQGAAEFRVFVKLKVAERLLEPFIIQLFKLPPYPYGLVQGIVSHGVGHQHEIFAHRFPDGCVDFHVKLRGSGGMGLVALDSPALVIEGLVHIVLDGT